MYCDSRKPLLTCVNAAHGFRMVTSDSYGIRRIRHCDDAEPSPGSRQQARTRRCQPRTAARCPCRRSHGRLEPLLVHNIGGNRTGSGVAGSGVDLEHRKLRVVRLDVMVSGDFEERVGGGVEACRSLGFHELVLAVINALEGSGVLAALGLGDGHLATVNGVIVRGAIELVELELRQIVLSRGATVEGLVDVQLVGEDDDLVGQGSCPECCCLRLAELVRVVGERQAGQRSFGLPGRADHSVHRSAWTVYSTMMHLPAATPVITLSSASEKANA